MTALWVADTVAMKRPSISVRLKLIHDNKREFLQTKGVTVWFFVYTLNVLIVTLGLELHG